MGWQVWHIVISSLKAMYVCKIFQTYSLNFKVIAALEREGESICICAYYIQMDKVTWLCN